MLVVLEKKSSPMGDLWSESGDGGTDKMLEMAQMAIKWLETAESPLMISKTHGNDRFLEGGESVSGGVGCEDDVRRLDRIRWEKLECLCKIVSSD
ncbi:hypothetical protein ACLOJK_017453 [Asimina triloba]